LTTTNRKKNNAEERMTLSREKLVFLKKEKEFLFD
jgi:hypothetical protein